MKTAKAAAAIEQEGSASGWDALQASEASAHGGQAARQYLLGLHSLRRIDETTVEELLEAAAVQVPRLRLQRSRSFTMGGRRRSRSGSGSWRGGRSRRDLYSAPTSPMASAGLDARAMSGGFGALVGAAGAAGGSSHAGAGNRSASRDSGSDGRRSGSWSLSAGRLLSALRSQSLPEEAGATCGAATTASAAGDSPARGAGSRSAIARAVNAGSPQALHPLRPVSAASGSGLLLSEYDIESQGDSRAMQPAAGSTAELEHAPKQQDRAGRLGSGGRGRPSL